MKIRPLKQPPKNKKNALFAKRLLDWFDLHGRKNLPWQQNINPYYVWISEIMLQQTQVITVIPYYEKFIKRFPDVASLAQAPIDEVLHYWTGLGYYARARNLHKTANIIATQYQGNFPDHLAAITALPGIGRSTAGAILAIAFQQSTPILDGNVKRVLARVHAIDKYPGEKETENYLWQIATDYTPMERTRDYTQAIMDLGATVCVRSQPNCAACPLQSDCLAFRSNTTKHYPVPKKKTTLPVKATAFLIFLTDDGETLLQKRSPMGIWGGLWGFPEYSDSVNWSVYCEQEFNIKVKSSETGAKFRHTFSHYHLDVLPIYIKVSKGNLLLRDDETLQWCHPNSLPRIGLAAPVRKLLKSLTLNQ